ncbi:hypothetical protein [Mesorhizobium sp. WSM3868]|uniref:hypothetical protein n=1 Tax=Mesorhizobium sp. WSM3868 TaxID=2029405 RepID=UPI001FE1B2AB|nr:hypothetical protein [Mesorhizobium sp. WSM3868]
MNLDERHLDLRLAPAAVSADKLDSAADRIADMSRADLQVMLRRAALMLRNVTALVLDPKVEQSLWTWLRKWARWSFSETIAGGIADRERLLAGALRA